MEFTGERFMPELEGGIVLEHKHRYLLACELAKDKEVLDIASGEGYGSFMLAGVARQVTGVDISHEAVAHARQKYSRNNLQFCQGSAAAIPLADASVDMVISFETIEHHDQHEEMLREIKRVLRPGGLLYMSSPDRYEYSDVPDYHNEYHVKELTKKEFEDLIGRHFANYTISGQRVVYGSVIGSETPHSTFLSWNNKGAVLAPDKGMSRAVYVLAMASDGELPEALSSTLEDALEYSDDFRRQEWRHEATLREHTAEREQHEHHLENLTRELQDCRAVLKNKDAEIENGLAALRNLEEQLNGMQNSCSWRITKPLRQLKKWLRSFFAEQPAPTWAAKMLARCLTVPLVLCARSDKTQTYAMDSVDKALNNPERAYNLFREQKNSRQHLAHMAFTLGWVTLRAGSLPAMLKVCLAALRSSDARRYLCGYIQLCAPSESAPVPAAATMPDNGYIGAVVRAHHEGLVLPPVTQVQVRAVAEGNHFFREIAQLVACGFEDAGVKASVIIDPAANPCPVTPEQPDMLQLIVAPHEYFYFIPSALAWSFTPGRLWLLNSEQGCTSWFERAAAAFGLADLVLDMDFDMSRTLTQQGLRAEHLPLGFSPNCGLFDGLQPVAAGPATLGLPSRIRESLVGTDPVGAPLLERPLDCCFFGAEVERRAAFFADNAALFAKLQCYLRLMPLTGPLQAGGNSLTTADISAIVRRSKITLNIHQTENSYFEWHRIVLQGLWQGTLVVSEPCTTALPFQPNVDYVSVDLAHMPEALEYFTASDDGRALAEKIRLHGYRTLTSQCLIGRNLRNLLDIYSVMPGVGR